VIAWSPDGSTLAVGTQHESVILWQPTEGLVTELDDLHAFVTSLAWSPDGQTIATGLEDGSNLLWDVPFNKQVNALFFPELLHCRSGLVAGWRHSGSSDLVCRPTLPENCSLVIWDLSNDKPLQAFQTGIYDFSSIAWSPGGAIIASALMNGDVILYNVDRNIRI